MTWKDAQIREASLFIAGGATGDVGRREWGRAKIFAQLPKGGGVKILDFSVKYDAPKQPRFNSAN